MKFFVIFLFLSALFVSCKPSADQALSSNNESNKTRQHELPDLPQFIIFCGQRINLKDEDIRERLDREILVNAYFQSATIQHLKRANRFFPSIERTLKREGIPDDLKYLAVIESGLTQAVSPAGAQGFWQFMPETATQYELQITDEIDERLHIEKSTIAACRYLKDAKNELGDWLLATASYNRGIGGVRNDMKWQGTTHYFDTHMNSETGRYVFRLLAVKLIFEQPEKYGFAIKKSALYKPLSTYNVTIKTSIPNLAKWALKMGINYKILVKLNPWILTNKLTVKNRFFVIQLPSKRTNLSPYKAID
jgi:membrane-bound lytic murein transglycosylase D